MPDNGSQYLAPFLPPLVPLSGNLLKLTRQFDVVFLSLWLYLSHPSIGINFPLSKLFYNTCMSSPQHTTQQHSSHDPFVFKISLCPLALDPSQYCAECSIYVERYFILCNTLVCYNTTSAQSSGQSIPYPHVPLAATPYRCSVDSSRLISTLLSTSVKSDHVHSSQWIGHTTPNHTCIQHALYDFDSSPSLPSILSSQSALIVPSSLSSSRTSDSLPRSSLPSTLYSSSLPKYSDIYVACHMTSWYECPGWRQLNAIIGTPLLLYIVQHLTLIHTGPKGAMICSGPFFDPDTVYHASRHDPASNSLIDGALSSINQPTPSSHSTPSFTDWKNMNTSHQAALMFWCDPLTNMPVPNSAFSSSTVSQGNPPVSYSCPVSKPVTIVISHPWFSAPYDSFSSSLVDTHVEFDNATASIRISPLRLPTSSAAASPSSATNHVSTNKSPITKSELPGPYSTIKNNATQIMLDTHSPSCRGLKNSSKHHKRARSRSTTAQHKNILKASRLSRDVSLTNYLLNNKSQLLLSTTILRGGFVSKVMTKPLPLRILSLFRHYIDVLQTTIQPKKVRRRQHRLTSSSSLPPDSSSPSASPRTPTSISFTPTSFSSSLSSSLSGRSSSFALPDSCTKFDTDALSDSGSRYNQHLPSRLVDAPIIEPLHPSRSLSSSWSWVSTHSSTSSKASNDNISISSSLSTGSHTRVRSLSHPLLLPSSMRIPTTAEYSALESNRSPAYITQLPRRMNASPVSRPVRSLSSTVLSVKDDISLPNSLISQSSRAPPPLQNSKRSRDSADDNLTPSKNKRPRHHELDTHIKHEASQDMNLLIGASHLPSQSQLTQSQALNPSPLSSPLPPLRQPLQFNTSTTPLFFIFRQVSPQTAQSSISKVSLRAFFPRISPSPLLLDSLRHLPCPSIFSSRRFRSNSNSYPVQYLPTMLQLSNGKRIGILEPTLPSLQALPSKHMFHYIPIILESVSVPSLNTIKPRTTSQSVPYHDPIGKLSKRQQRRIKQTKNRSPGITVPSLPLLSPLPSSNSHIYSSSEYNSTNVHSFRPPSSQQSDEIIFTVSTFQPWAQVLLGFIYKLGFTHTRRKLDQLIPYSHLLDNRKSNKDAPSALPHPSYPDNHSPKSTIIPPIVSLNQIPPLLVLSVAAPLKCVPTPLVSQATLQRLSPLVARLVINQRLVPYSLLASLTLDSPPPSVSNNQTSTLSPSIDTMDPDTMNLIKKFTMSQRTKTKSAATGVQRQHHSLLSPSDITPQDREQLAAIIGRISKRDVPFTHVRLYFTLYLALIIPLDLFGTVHNTCCIITNILSFMLEQSPMSSTLYTASDLIKGVDTRSIPWLPHQHMKEKDQRRKVGGKKKYKQPSSYPSHDGSFKPTINQSHTDSPLIRIQHNHLLLHLVIFITHFICIPHFNTTFQRLVKEPASQVFYRAKEWKLIHMFTLLEMKSHYTLLHDNQGPIQNAMKKLVESYTVPLLRSMSIIQPTIYSYVAKPWDFSHVMLQLVLKKAGVRFIANHSHHYTSTPSPLAIMIAASKRGVKTFSSPGLTCPLYNTPIESVLPPTINISNSISPSSSKLDQGLLHCPILKRGSQMCSNTAQQETGFNSNLSVCVPQVPHSRISIDTKATTLLSVISSTSSSTVEKSTPHSSLYKRKTGQSKDTTTILEPVHNIKQENDSILVFPSNQLPVGNSLCDRLVPSSSSSSVSSNNTPIPSLIPYLPLSNISSSLSSNQQHIAPPQPHQQHIAPPQPNQQHPQDILNTPQSYDYDSITLRSSNSKYRTLLPFLLHAIAHYNKTYFSTFTSRHSGALSIQNKNDSSNDAIYTRESLEKRLLDRYMLSIIPISYILSGLRMINIPVILPHTTRIMIPQNDRPSSKELPLNRISKPTRTINNSCSVGTTPQEWLKLQPGLSRVNSSLGLNGSSIRGHDDIHDRLLFFAHHRSHPSQCSFYHNTSPSTASHHYPDGPNSDHNNECVKHHPYHRDICQICIDRTIYSSETFFNPIDCPPLAYPPDNRLAACIQANHANIMTSISNRHTLYSSILDLSNHSSMSALSNGDDKLVTSDMLQTYSWLYTIYLESYNTGMHHGSDFCLPNSIDYFFTFVKDHYPEHYADIHRVHTTLSLPNTPIPFVYSLTLDIEKCYDNISPDMLLSLVSAILHNNPLPHLSFPSTSTPGHTSNSNATHPLNIDPEYCTIPLVKSAIYGEKVYYAYHSLVTSSHTLDKTPTLQHTSRKPHGYNNSNTLQPSTTDFDTSTGNLESITNLYLSSSHTRSNRGHMLYDTSLAPLYNSTNHDGLLPYLSIISSCESQYFTTKSDNKNTVDHTHGTNNYITQLLLPHTPNPSRHQLLVSISNTTSNPSSHIHQAKTSLSQLFDASSAMASALPPLLHRFPHIMFKPPHPHSTVYKRSKFKYRASNLISRFRSMLTDTSVRLAAHFYKQKRGIPQGNVLSPIFADLFLGQIEREAHQLMAKHDYIKQCLVISRIPIFKRSIIPIPTPTTHIPSPKLSPPPNYIKWPSDLLVMRKMDDIMILSTSISLLTIIPSLCITLGQAGLSLKTSKIKANLDINIGGQSPLGNLSNSIVGNSDKQCPSDTKPNHPNQPPSSNPHPVQRHITWNGLILDTLSLTLRSDYTRMFGNPGQNLVVHPKRTQLQHRAKRQTRKLKKYHAQTQFSMLNILKHSSNSDKVYIYRRLQSLFHTASNLLYSTASDQSHTPLLFHSHASSSSAERKTLLRYTKLKARNALLTDLTFQKSPILQQQQQQQSSSSPIAKESQGYLIPLPPPRITTRHWLPNFIQRSMHYRLLPTLTSTLLNGYRGVLLNIYQAVYVCGIRLIYACAYIFKRSSSNVLTPPHQNNHSRKTTSSQFLLSPDRVQAQSLLQRKVRGTYTDKTRSNHSRHITLRSLANKINEISLSLPDIHHDSTLVEPWMLFNYGNTFFSLYHRSCRRLLRIILRRSELVYQRHCIVTSGQHNDNNSLQSPTATIQYIHNCAAGLNDGFTSSDTTHSSTCDTGIVSHIPRSILSDTIHRGFYDALNNTLPHVLLSPGLSQNNTAIKNRSKQPSATGLLSTKEIKTLQRSSLYKIFSWLHIHVSKRSVYTTDLFHTSLLVWIRSNSSAIIQNIVYRP